MKARRSLSVFLFSIISLTSVAQVDIAKRIEEENVVAGFIIKDGKEIPGYVRKMGTTPLPGSTDIYPAPWEFQKDIRFMEKNAFETAEKIKNKDFSKYEPDDLDGYKYDTLAFESVKYSDMSAVGTGMIARKMFMRKLKDGKISLFAHFSMPIVVGEVSEFKTSYEECAQPNIVYRIGKDGKLKLVNSLNVKKELAACPVVVEKYEKGDYGISGENKTGLAKLADKTILRDGVRLAVIDDYNVQCQ